MKTIQKNNKNLKYYLDLKYPIEIVEDDGAWTASVPDLPGCNSFGEDVAQAVKNVEEAKALWIESQLKSGGEVPEPTEEDEFSGRFVLRIPRVLHRNLAYEARRQGVSLNQYASHLLSQRQPMNAFMNIAQSLFEKCAWRAPWTLGYHGHDSSVIMGRTAANIDFLMCLRKPAATGSFKANIPSAMRKQYLLTD